MVSKFHSGLSQDLFSMLNDDDEHNVIIQVGVNKNTKEFRVHSNILKARSPYFKSAFSAGWIVKNNNNMVEFKKPNINPTVFEMILKYMYTGEVDLTKQSGENILGLLVASDELLLDELFKHVQGHLIEKQTTWVENNFVLVLHTVFKIPSCKKLQDYCLESICADPQPFITSKEFPSLDKDILYGLLKRDDLQIEEIVAWDNLIKWGIEQTPGLGSRNQDRAKWNYSNYEALEKTLSQFIPLIRFSEISSKDFFDKVRPYKVVIPDHIYEEIMEFYMKDTSPKTTTLPPRVGKSHIDSNIINSKLISVIINWIERKDAKAIRNKKLHKFDLIYRGSQTGINANYQGSQPSRINPNYRGTGSLLSNFYSQIPNCNYQGNIQTGRIDSNSFRKSCENVQVPILVLVKCQNSRKIFGGYTPVGFNFYHDSEDDSEVDSEVDSEDYIYSKDSFIFSLENDDIQSMKLSRVTSYDHAIYNNQSTSIYGFNFGDTLYMQNQNLYLDNYNGYYEYDRNNMDDSYVYTIEEIEAFKVVISNY